MNGGQKENKAEVKLGARRTPPPPLRGFITTIGKPTTAMETASDAAALQLMTSLPSSRVPILHHPKWVGNWRGFEFAP